MTTSETLDVFQDFLNWDNTEQVDVTLDRKTTGCVVRTVDNALRRAITGSDTRTAGIQLGSDTTVWNIPAAQLETSDEIQEGDTITDEDSVVWIVKSIALLTFRSRWRCVCVKQR